MKLQLRMEGSHYDVEVTSDAIVIDGYVFKRDDLPTATIDPQGGHVAGSLVTFVITGMQGLGGAGGGGSGSGDVSPPMTGRLVSISVEVGQEVAQGDTLFVLEAMKMQNKVKSPMAGTIQAIHAAAGATVEPSDLILTVA